MTANICVYNCTGYGILKGIDRQRGINPSGELETCVEIQPKQELI